eukprot:13723604-Alexandrium_andersonii.AAC.1
MAAVCSCRVASLGRWTCSYEGVPIGHPLSKVACSIHLGRLEGEWSGNTERLRSDGWLASGLEA